MFPKVTVTESRFVKVPPQDLWDYTQDFSQRRKWDRSILAAEVLEAGATPRVRIRAAGGVSAVLHYKQFTRPQQTSLVMEEVQSWLVEGRRG